MSPRCIEIPDANALQLRLDDPVDMQAAEHRPYAGRDPMREAMKLRAANPHAYQMLVDWSLDDLARGRRCCIAFYCELLRRPEYHVGRVKGSPYVVNNTARSGLVRMLIAEHPQLDGAFEERASRADRP
jgi:hypothetical protein